LAAFGQAVGETRQRGVAIARKLLVAIWHVLSKEETDRNASEEDLAWKMLLWSWSLGDEARLGLTPKQFAKYSLLRLGVEKDGSPVINGKRSMCYHREPKGVPDEQ